MTLPPLKGKALTAASWIIVAALFAQWAGWLTPPYITATVRETSEQAVIKALAEQVTRIADAQQRAAEQTMVLQERLENERRLADRLEQRLFAMEMVLYAIERETGAQR